MSLEVYFEPKEQTIRSAEGKTIYLSDSDNKQLVSAKLNGETSQTTSEQGSNLFDENYYKNASYNTNDYKTILARFKGNRKLYFKASLKEGKTNISGAYICISATPNPNNSNGYYAMAVRAGVISNQNKDFTGYNDIYFAFYPTNLSITNIFDTYNFWVSTDDITYTPFVPNMPSPDYPSEIKNLEGRNKLSLTNNTYTNRGITAVVSNGIITLSGTSNDSSMASIIDIPLINPIPSSIGTVIKSLNPTGTYTGVQTSLRASNAATSVGLWSNNAATQSGTLSGNAYYLRIQINYNTTVDCILKPQIEERSISNRICSI